MLAKHTNYIIQAFKQCYEHLTDSAGQIHQLQAFKHCYEHLIESAPAVGGSASAFDGLLRQLILKLHTPEQEPCSSVHTANRLGL